MSHTDDVKAMLVRQRIKQSEIADELAVTRGAVSSVLNGHSNSRRIKKHIAERLNKPYERIWGKRARA